MIHLPAHASVPRPRQGWVAVLGMLLALAIFMTIERIVTPRYSFVTPLDRTIPFIPLTWLLYIMFFPLVVVAAACAEPSAFSRFRQAVVLAFMVSIVCFGLFPEIVPRPDPATIGNAFLRQRLARLWMLDLASNGLPSLHVSVTCLTCRMLWRPRYRWLIGLTGLLICASTLTLKQHTVIDVVGGLLLALLCARLPHQSRKPGAVHGHA